MNNTFTTFVHPTPGADPSPLRKAHLGAAELYRHALSEVQDEEAIVARRERELSQARIALSDSQDRLAVAKAAMDAIEAAVIADEYVEEAE